MKTMFAVAVLSAALAQFVSAQDFSRETIQSAERLIKAARHDARADKAQSLSDVPAAPAGRLSDAAVGPKEIGMLGEWRKLPDCRSADGGRQNITSTISIFADHTAESVILSYRQEDRSCSRGRIGRTVARWQYSIEGPSAVEPGAFKTKWTIKSVRVTANNGDVWDRTSEFGGKVSRNTVKIVERDGDSFYYKSDDDDSEGRLQSSPTYVLVRP